MHERPLSPYCLPLLCILSACTFLLFTGATLSFFSSFTFKRAIAAEGGIRAEDGYVGSLPESDEKTRSKPLYGLSMHGVPLHDENSPSLTYVDPTAPKGGRIAYAAIGSFDSLNPFALKGTAAAGLNYTYERLMERAWDEPFTLYPLIAQSYEIADDRSWIIFNLDPAARFADGSPVTADDALFSFNTLKEDGRPNFRRVYNLVEKVTVINDRKIKFEFGPGYDRESALILAIMPVLSRKYWQDRDFDSSTLDLPLTSGPYEIAEVRPGSEITYRLRKDYWGEDLFINKGLHNFDEITVKYFRDKNIAYEAFLAGDLSLWREDDAGRWDRLLALSLESANNAESAAVNTEAFPHKRPELVHALIFNTRRSPFDNIKVRKALSLAFPAYWINETLYNGRFHRIESYYPNSELAATGMPSPDELETLKKWEHKLPDEVFGQSYTPASNKDRNEVRKNLRQADTLLKESGWIVRNGKRVNLQSEELLEFTLILKESRQKSVALAFARALERLGITVHVRMLDSAAFIGRLNDYDYDMVLHYWQSTLSPGTEQILFWGCKSAEQKARWNYAGICHPAIDFISRQIAHSETRKNLVSLTRALDRILTNGHYMIPLFYRGEDWIAYNSALNHPEYVPIYGPVQESWWKTTKMKDVD